MSLRSLISGLLAAASVCVLILTGPAPPARAADGGDYGAFKFYSVKAKFDDVKFDLENALVSRGFKVDHHGFIGKMLDRTGPDVGDTTPIYKNAEYFVFCSATLSRNALKADRRNIGFCPYVVTIYHTVEDPGTVVVGYRRVDVLGSEGSKKAMEAVNKVLDGIAREATGQ
ncbi:MAG: hypothetical protein VW268_04940 [Rhodospirillaceae bacterium]